MKYILILIQLLIFVGESHSDDFYDKKVSKVDLVPKESVFKIKNEYYFGIKFKMNEGWKTYWKNPGDAGLPVDIKFLGDKSHIKAEILFPFPKRFFDKDILTIGYENEILFPVKIINNNNDDKIETIIQIDYLVCKDVCIPITEKKKLNLNFTEVNNTSYFLKYFNKVPKVENQKIDIIKKKDIDENTLEFDIRSRNESEINDIFLYSPESNLRLEQKGKGYSSYILKSEKKISEISSTILISMFNGEQYFEFPLKLKNEDNYNDLILFIFLAFVGGFILNFMPCVLPVLSLKL